MLPNQRKSRIVVIEGRVAPAAGNMAGSAIRSKLSAMRVFGRVTRVAILRCTFIDTVSMARCAGEIRVLARQGKSRLAVVKSRIRPIAGLMAGRTICAELTAMCIPGRMTRVTILWHAFI